MNIVGKPALNLRTLPVQLIMSRKFDIFHQNLGINRFSVVLGQYMPGMPMGHDVAIRTHRQAIRSICETKQ